MRIVRRITIILKGPILSGSGNPFQISTSDTIFINFEGFNLDTKTTSCNTARLSINCDSIKTAAVMIATLLVDQNEIG